MPRARRRVPPVVATQTPFRLGLDLDGVFADFNGDPDYHGAARLLVAATQVDLLPRPCPPPPCWGWMKHYGYRPSQEATLWETINASPTFWRDLRPLPGAIKLLCAIRLLEQTGQVLPTFLTTRPGLQARLQSVLWLREMGRFDTPQVCVCGSSEDKGVMARGLKLDAMVDDYPPNLEAIRRHSPDTVAIYYRQPWTAEMVLAEGVVTVDGAEALEAWLVAQIEANAAATT